MATEAKLYRIKLKKMLNIFIKQCITDFHHSEETCNNESFVSKSDIPLFKNSSTLRAHSLPSLIAHTTSD
jgi:hypothetical protein